ncbi:dynein regulatory complex subunit 3 isoform X1 [Monomorium pharaonis]|uniref:dynein regulatory complex subunit 3 isoform X1 n=1 Tax=Monomorium pharaonis TaxID=307658 RepID=UPI00063F0462|nr:dynein regulatory complex subunit 3 isoform X1 [Monomorium pharaonis]XP_028048097.1 dynein regulatory complex subunit 3 isoform X1 [Monomorium pharaonis]XP_036148543.1 dynein regulatory complex subunit 3 isoform X1 [Monomorium pharaonis]
MHKTDTIRALREAMEPGVITRSMLVSLAIDQGPKKEGGRLFLQDGIQLDKLEEIRIEFLKILNIDYLWILKNLVKLSLSHNIIEKIENLYELCHLKELDLSFNRIKIMENLNNLHQLEILLLYSNEISIVQGISNLKKLTILNIGKNKIDDWKHVVYLREFKLLKSLNMRDNPCTEMDGYLDYLFAFVPQLIYYQYRMISENERQSAIDKHYRIISSLEENEAKMQMELAMQREREDKITLLSASYVEFLDDDYLFQQMFSSDEAGRTLSTINENTQNAFEEYKKSFLAICYELYELGLRESDRRTEEIRLFEIAINESKENTQNKARRIVDEVLEKKVKIFTDIKNVMEALIEKQEEDAENTAAKARELFNEFNDLLSKAQNRLISIEVILHDQMEDINEVFRIDISDMVNSFLKDTQGYFSLLRNAEIEYNNIINGLIVHYLSGFGDKVYIPFHLKNLCCDKDTLATTLATSHDIHLQVIDNREKHMISRLNNWLKDYIDQLIMNEDKRNRQQILEMSNFIEFQQQQLNLLSLPQHLDLADIDLHDDGILEN